ncbi:hypothetical protein C6341_g3458 [Phytophthora cactorum]|nr:hypothetical protein C6341_g3458 [Phytophthora cactorum]
MTQTFTFGWEMDNAGKPIVGNGADEKPFIVGLSTKALMLRLMVPPESFIMHLDGMYKMNQCEYPVLVVGRSTISTSTILWMTQKHLIVKYALADGDKAQCMV